MSKKTTPDEPNTNTLPKKQFKFKLKKSVVITGLSIIALITVLIVVIITRSNNESLTYKEAVAAVGRLTVGVSVSGSLDVGTTTQTFEPDISEYSGESVYTSENTMAFSFGMGEGGGAMSLFGNSNDTSGDTQTTSGDNRQLMVDEVYVKDGQFIEKGAPILHLTTDSVESIRTQLHEDVSEAQTVYDQMLTAQKQTAQEAHSEQQLNLTNGTYARREYDRLVVTAQNEAAAKETALNEARDALSTAQTDLADAARLLAEEQKVLENARYSLEYTDRDSDMYWWLTAADIVTSAEETVTSLTEQVETLSDEAEAAEATAATAEADWTQAKKQLEATVVTAGTQLKKDQYLSSSSQEIYDIAITESEFNTAQAEADYQEAAAKLTAFDEVVVDDTIYADYRGLITTTAVTVGDVLSRDSELLVLSDYDAVTVTVEVGEDDMTAAALGNEVNITVDAFPDQLYRGTVTAVGDATIDSNTNKTVFSVTVTMTDTAVSNSTAAETAAGIETDNNTGNETDADTSAGTDTLFYQDMTAEVTFITEESAEVLYIPSKAILQDEDITYVMVRNGDGRIVKQEVETGFSDGFNTEIKNGLTAGDTVVWEGTVTRS